MKTLIIGTGLIGGSFAYRLQACKMTSKIYGWDNNPQHLQKAKSLHIIDEIFSEKHKSELSLIILSVPVNEVLQLLPQWLDQIQPHQVIIDVSSSKYVLSKTIDKHPNRKNFISTHPMWGTEYSGPEAAQKQSFQGRNCVICDVQKSDSIKTSMVEKIYEKLGMNLVYMNSKEHDLHMAYISHISHITSFALANAVLKKEKSVEKIFQLAGGGFESTVRLAKSSPAMWTPIFIQNQKNVLNVLDENIRQLQLFKQHLKKQDAKKIFKYIQNANIIKKIIK